MSLRWSRSHAYALTTILTGALVALPATDASAGPDSTYNVGVLMESGWDVTLGPDGSFTKPAGRVSAQASGRPGSVFPGAGP